MTANNNEIEMDSDHVSNYIRFLDLSKLKLKEITINTIKKFALWTLSSDHLLYPLFNISQIDLSKLEYLNLDDNQLTKVHPDLFSGMTSLKTLSLRRNRLTTIPNKIFHHLSELEKLYLDNNQLKNLSVQVFNGQINLQTLSITSNQLTSLPEKVFSNLKNLRRLYLNYNSIETLPDKIFHNLKNIKFLFMRNNNLLRLNEDLFINLIRLQRLNLVNNELTYLPDGIFRSQINLRVLFLDIAKFENFPGSLAVCRNLETLSQKHDETDYSLIQASIKGKFPEYISGEHYDFINEKEEIGKYKQKIRVFEDNLFCIHCGSQNLSGDKYCTACNHKLFY